MKNLILASSLICFLASCSKSDSGTNPNPNPNPIIPDTLSTGWVKATNAAPTLSTTDFFTNANTGFVTSQSGIYKSADGGVNWTFFNANNNAFNIGGFGTKYCFVGSDNKLNYTTNTTDFFSPVYILANPGAPPVTLSFRDCFFSSQNIVYACSDRYIYKSANGGVSFDSIYVFPSGNVSNSIFFVNDLTGWLIRSNGLYKTIDGGLNWTLNLPINPALTGAIDFISPTVGVFSDNTSAYKTIDGGANWTPIYTGFTNTFIDVDIISGNEIYISGGSKIYKTANGGTSWSQVLSSGQNGIIEIHFIDANTGWACGGNGAIYRYKP
jgi:photosystem II stability/assembly factor-like uncharacterized protein